MSRELDLEVAEKVMREKPPEGSTFDAARHEWVQYDPSWARFSWPLPYSGEMALSMLVVDKMVAEGFEATMEHAKGGLSQGRWFAGFNLPGQSGPFAVEDTLAEAICRVALKAKEGVR